VTVLTRRVLSMATGTLASRATGLLRVLVLAWVLGFSPLADAYNLANTVPNMLYDLVLGGVASATFIPVFVEYLAREGERKAWRSISAIVTLAIGVLAVATVVTWFAAPAIVHGFTVWHPHLDTTLPAQRAAAVGLLRWFAPQIFCYGLLSIAGALLNARHRFGAVAWAPIANNIVCIAVLILFHVSAAHPDAAGLHGGQLTLLGLGTTLGVVVQCLVLGPSLARARLGRLRLKWDVHDPAVRQVLRLGAWTTANVVANQVSLAVVLALAFGLGGSGSVSAYTYGWSFMQMPYAVVVVSVLNALTPALAADAALGRLRQLESDARRGLTHALFVILPATVGLVVLAQPLVQLLFHHRAGTHAAAGVALATLAAGLPGFTIYAVVIRVLQTMQHGRDTFVLYGVQNGLTVLFAWAWGRHTLGGIVGAVSLAYTLAAVLALVMLATRSVRLTPVFQDRDLWRVTGATLLGGVVMTVVVNVVEWSGTVGLLVRTVTAGVVGASVIYASTRTVWAAFLPARQNREKVEEF
jgi:putative peptidoglycan lipid II flippase